MNLLVDGCIGKCLTWSGRAFVKMRRGVECVVGFELRILAA